jgi:type I restriction enzyme S subunit
MISYAQFSELLLPIPGHDEQTKIADCLNSLDELIAVQSRKVGALKTHKKGPSPFTWCKTRGPNALIRG